MFVINENSNKKIKTVAKIDGGKYNNKNVYKILSYSHNYRNLLTKNWP